MLSPETFDALRKLDACALANAIETFNERLRNEGFMNGSVQCLFPRLEPMLGYAATVVIRGAAAPYAGLPYAARTDWWDYVQSLPSPRVLVVLDATSCAGTGSLIGAVHMNILRALGCIGVVTNGAVRDIPAAEKAGFHYFAGNISVSHAYVHIVEFGAEVEVGGLKVRSGDLLHGDLHGVQNVPLDLASRISAAAAKIAADEAKIIALCHSNEFSLAKLHQAVRKGRV